MDLEPADLWKCDWPQDLDCRYDTKIYRGVAGKLSQSSIIYRQQPAAGDRVGSHAALQHCSTAAGHCTLQQCAVTVHADWGGHCTSHGLAILKVRSVGNMDNFI